MWFMTLGQIVNDQMTWMFTLSNYLTPLLQMWKYSLINSAKYNYMQLPQYSQLLLNICICLCSSSTSIAILSNLQTDQKIWHPVYSIYSLLGSLTWLGNVGVVLSWGLEFYSLTVLFEFKFKSSSLICFSHNLSHFDRITGILGRFFASFSVIANMKSYSMCLPFCKGQSLLSSRP